MSFQAWVQWFEEGHQATVPLAAVEAAFAGSVIGHEGAYWQLRHDSPGCCEVHVKSGTDDAVSCVTLSRPCGARALWDSVFALLSAGNGVCYWPGSALIVANADVAAHLAPEMRTVLGEPTVVQSGVTIAMQVDRG